MKKFCTILVSSIVVLLCSHRFEGQTPSVTHSKKAGQANVDWHDYGGDARSDHYSGLAQINRKNVSGLTEVWRFDTGETGGLETNPIIVDGVLYACSPTHHVIALNAGTGKLLWKFDSGQRGSAICRGVTYWSDGKDSRILVGFRNFLYEVDAKTGKSIERFGEDGKIDLRKELRGDDYQAQSVSLTSPGVIYEDLIIVGGGLPETLPAPPGDVRAFDVRTGTMRWSFHTIPHPGERGYDSWPEDGWKTGGGANNWAGMAVDVKRGVVYVPTGSAAFDFYGGNRLGDNLFANSIIALDASTGKRLWHFQGVHHDVWDRDFPAPPVLTTVKRNGKSIDAIAQTTKAGFIFVLDRATGKPLFPVEEKKFPGSAVPGERTSPTQPIPKLPLPFTRQTLNENMLTSRTPEAHAWALKEFRSAISGGQFIPPTLDKLTLDMPGFAGGGEWGGAAVNPKTGILYVNANDTAWVVGLTVPAVAGTPGEKLYQNQCSSCHGVNRAGSPPTVPSLNSIERRLTDGEIEDIIHQGRRRMPAFSNLSDNEASLIVEYLVKSKAIPRRTADAPAVAAAQTGSEKDLMPYKTIGYRRFLDPEGYPAVSTPWGTLNAIDLNTGKYLWKIPFGEYPELAAAGMKNTGSDNYGGPVVTAGGLVLIGATVFDQKFHAYDSDTGKLLWETKLPFSGLATPATYMVNGKQYVVIACGGGQTSKKPTGGLYIAFALP